MAFPDRLKGLYPDELSLQSVHVFFRHGARTPTSPLFVKETGLPMYWPLCTAARHMTSAIFRQDNQVNQESLQWTRMLETFRPDDGPSLNNNSFDLCNHGELTDTGRSMMLELGKQLRHLYVNQLELLPAVLTDPGSVYFRSSPFPRALESLQHTIRGFLPPGTVSPSFGFPRIVMRSPQDETLLPNEDHCQRFIQICKAYSRRTANKWNDTTDMRYLNALLRKSMPSKQTVAVNSDPGIHAIHDMISTTSASATKDVRLPEEFYDPKLGDIVDRIAYEEEYSAYQESHEMRRLGIGALLGDVVERMIFDAERRSTNLADRSFSGSSPKLFLAGSHDSTLGAIVASLGAVDAKSSRKWPPYGSVLAIELFCEHNNGSFSGKDPQDKDTPDSPPIVRTPTSHLSPNQKARLTHHYVRIRYNDQLLTVPGCKGAGRNWRGNESFCSLAAFKEIVDHFTPADWKQACVQNLGKSCFPEDMEPAGY